MPAALRLAAVPEGQVGLTYLAHASFVIETAAGVTAVTDYNGIFTPAVPPDIVTMNNSHSTHYTNTPDPRIRHVLRGWDPDGGIAGHDLRVDDLRVFNIPTNISDRGDGRQSNGNSIFVFDTAGLCLVHLGHLHHYLNDDQQRQLRGADVLFVPIDGSVTMSHQEALHVIDQIKPRLIVPMHYSFGNAAGIFAKAVSYPVRHLGTASLTLGKGDLPKDTEVWFFETRYSDY
jgi:L-ascorbate metabolism protein UlaG (beta-lactamase superfamily)